jgi:methylated-DNA-[protein]-cysteine S-methyltransferase
MELLSAPVDSPFGVLTVHVSARGVRAVQWPDDADRSFVGDDSVGSGTSSLLDETVRQLVDYFAGRRRDFDLPLDVIGTDFQKSAWRVLCGIPFGETISYGEQARRLGDSRKARAVGGANGRNPVPIIVPCHRVIGADGSLTGFGPGIESKKWLLAHEAVVGSKTSVAS